VNDDMPERDVRHQLADEALNEFRYRIRRPHQFLDVIAQHEYGIDGHVELFESTGKATGLRLAVQSKGTDDHDIRNVRFKRKHYNYYRALEEPVLVVRYNSASGQLYARWFHSHPGPRTPDQKSFTFELRDQDAWSDKTLDALRHGVEAYRHWRRPGLPRPIHLWLDLDGPVGSGAEVASRLRVAFDDVRGLVVPRAGAHPPGQAVLELGPSKVRVNLGDVASITWPAENGLAFATEDPDSVLLLLAAVLERVGQFDIASQLSLEAAEGANIVSAPPIATAVTSALLAAGRGSELLDLARYLDARDADRREASALMVLAVRSQVAALPRRVRRKLVEEYSQRLERHSPPPPAEELYSFANLLRGNDMGSERDARAALRIYRLAAKAQPSYRTRHYWLSDVAGAMFDLGFPRFSARYYRAALDEGADTPVMALLADALLRSGLYLQAQHVLEEYMAVVQQPLPHEWLALHAVRTIIRTTGKEQQPGACVDRFGAAGVDGSESATVVEQRMLAEIRENGLNPLAWFNLGSALANRGAFPEAFWASVVAATLEPFSVEDWSQAAQVALLSPDLLLLPDQNDEERAQTLYAVLHAGYAIVHDALPLKLLEATAPWPEGMRQILGELLEEVASSHGEVYKRPFVLRQHEPDGTWSEVGLGD